MPPPDVMYCSQQINIPPELPDILKQFTKAAIRTQPQDVLAWSAAYFCALLKGEPLPVKRRIEPWCIGLTPGLLDVLLNQLRDRNTVTLSLLSKKWADLGLPKTQLMEIMAVGGFAHEFEFMKFFSVACCHLGGNNLADAMKIICSILTDDPDGGPDRIPFETFKTLYYYLAGLSGDINQEQIDDVFAYLEDDVKKQDGLVMPRNFLSGNCPNLNSFPPEEELIGA